MSASEDIQLCPTLRSAPHYRKLPLAVLYALPRGRLWPVPGPGWESQPHTPSVGQLGSLSQLPSAQENQLESHCRSAFSARLSFALSYISWEHCPRPISLLHLPHHYRVSSREPHLKHRDRGSNELSPEDPKAAVNITGGERESLAKQKTSELLFNSLWWNYSIFQRSSTLASRNSLELCLYFCRETIPRISSDHGSYNWLASHLPDAIWQNRCCVNP